MLLKEGLMNSKFFKIDFIPCKKIYKYIFWTQLKKNHRMAFEFSPLSFGKETQWTARWNGKMYNHGKNVQKNFPPASIWNQ